MGSGQKHGEVSVWQARVRRSRLQLSLRTETLVCVVPRSPFYFLLSFSCLLEQQALYFLPTYHAPTLSASLPSLPPLLPSSTSYLLLAYSPPTTYHAPTPSASLPSLLPSTFYLRLPSTWSPSAWSGSWAHAGKKMLPFACGRGARRKRRKKKQKSPQGQNDGRRSTRRDCGARTSSEPGEDDSSFFSYAPLSICSPPSLTRTPPCLLPS